MMKWERPQTEVQKFEANEYVAACDNNTYTAYKFSCDAGNPAWERVWQVFLDDGTEITNQNGQIMFKQCGKEHTASTQDVFQHGYMHYYNNPLSDKTYDIPVIIWRGENGNEVHCTTKLDITKWEIIRS